MGPVVLILIVVLVIVFIILSTYINSQRRKVLIAWAHKRGLTFNSQRDSSFGRLFPDLECLHRGHSRYARNVMKGELNGNTITAFDYHYTTGHGKNRSHHNFSALILHSPLPLRPLFIRRENVFDKVTEFLGMDDIDFESAEFSRKFYVKAEDKRWAYDVIHPRMMEYLLSAPSFSVQFDFTNIIAWRNRRFGPTEFEQAAVLINGILKRLPTYLLPKEQRLKSEHPPKKKPLGNGPKGQKIRKEP
jgi:hypothetical protein